MIYKRDEHAVRLRDCKMWNGRAGGRRAQAGADTLLLTRDATGATPAQLAVEKGHRYLGLSLADYRRRAPRLPGPDWAGCVKSPPQ